MSHRAPLTSPLIAAICGSAVAYSVLAAAPAHADPEKSYQAGKALAGTPPVDDRGAGERAAQQMKDWGAGKKDSNAWKVDPNYNNPSKPSR